MSIVTCEDCDEQIDSDFEDCFEADGTVLCDSCRDNRDEAAYDRQQTKLMEGPPDTRREDQQLRDAGRGHLVR